MHPYFKPTKQKSNPKILAWKTNFNFNLCTEDDLKNVNMEDNHKNVKMEDDLKILKIEDDSG